MNSFSDFSAKTSNLVEKAKLLCNESGKLLEGACFLFRFIKQNLEILDKFASNVRI